MIGTIPTDADAERFSDYLVTQQIGNMVEESAAGDWSVWVENDDHLDRAKSELHAFLQNPADAKVRRRRRPRRREHPQGAGAEAEEESARSTSTCAPAGASPASGTRRSRSS